MKPTAASAPRAASLLERTLAYAIDSLVTLVAWLAIALPLVGGSPSQLTAVNAQGVIAGMLFLLIPFLYLVLAEGLTGTTVGKRVLGLQVVDTGGAPSSLFQATVRNVVRLAWALWPIGPLFLLIDVYLLQTTEDDQRVGDTAAGTRVVRGRTGLLG